MTREMAEAIAEALGHATAGGLYPIVAYGVSDGGITVLTTNISELSYALRILRTATGREYNLGYYFHRPVLERAARENPHVFRLQDFGVDGIRNAEAGDIGRIVRMFGAPFFSQKAFGLVDIVGFSRLNHADQLSHLYSLNNILSSSMRRCYKFCRRIGLNNTYGASTTGDGYYFWHDANGGNADVATFMLLICMMTQSEYIRQEALPLRLRGVYVIDSAFMIYTQRDVFTIDAPATTAVGAATNGAARLSTAAKPSQILLGDFKRPGQGGETMDPRSLLAQVNELFREESAGAATLVCDPDEKLRVEDKHGDLWYCWNISREVPNVGADGPTRQAIGLKTDSAHDIHTIRLRSEP